jgi:hypothetical protein
VRRLIAACGLLPALASAQVLVGMSTDKEHVAVEEPFKLIVTLKERDTMWCGLRVSFGDGEVRDVRVEQTPLTLVKKYAAPGRYEIRAEGQYLPRGLRTALACQGNLQTGFVDVADPAVEAKRQAEARELERRKRELEEKERQLRQREQELERERERERQRQAGAPAPAPAPAPATRKPGPPPAGAPAPAPAGKPPQASPTPPPSPQASAAKPKPKDPTLKVF